MNIATLLLLSFSVVSCVGIEDVSDDPLTIFDPMETEGVFSQYDEPNDADPLPDLSPIDEDIDTDIEEVDEEDTSPDEFFDSEIKDANRLSCPFSGKNCRFKKAKCRCSSNDGDFKFTMKKFGTVDDGKTEGSQSGSEKQDKDEGQSMSQQQAKSDEQPMSQQQEPEPSAKEIVQEVPEMIEGFQMLEQLNDPTQVVLGESPEGADSQVSSDDSGLQMVPSATNKDEFEDKTIRVRTEDKKDKNKKVHEYEYLRVKKVDKKNGVKETHLESPESENPSVSYHKGAIPKMDHSVKSRLSPVFPPKADEEAQGPIEAIEYAAPLPIEYGSADDAPAVLTPAEKVKRKLAEIEQRRLASQSQSQSAAIPAYYNKEMALKTYEPVVVKGLKGPVGPTTPKFVSLSYPGGVTDLTASQFSGGAQTRSLKKKKNAKKSKKNGKKSKKNAKKSKKTKEDKLAEKEKKKELKKKKKLMKEYKEKTDNTIMEKMKERDRILAEKLEKEKEELEKKQEAGTFIAKRVKQLQAEKDKQEKKIRLAEKQIQTKRDRERKLEKAEKLKQIKKEKKLLREQEKQLDQMKGDSIDDEVDPSTGSRLLEKV
ncbi:hypothetical protein TpMuguga_03g00247 [Theileria parva strain Muguga]|uniref:Uncharacterized protein n=1 Tax=Theileria parva TaxID=5875 RepID=Q4N0A4_THEPA|nr:uncharacterized protein TpMuguga_03g00247 [Theileria parva strain Muguga]EAN30982.1 hypothetical protein TpMuguga_03g00247 [Theileria parva strain Muguga]|eukprot:XP_763265.1 hypothetical protein [Theileria parva strain Muguga]